MKSSFSKEGRIFLVLGVIFASLLLMPYLHGHWRLADDAYIAYLQRYMLQERMLKLDHQWPWWIPTVGLGQPAALNAGATWFYPPQVLWGLLVGWSETSYLYFLLIHIAIGVWLAAKFARQVGLTFAASLFFAFAFAGNGYVLGLLSNPCLIIPYLVWPLLLSGLHEFHRKGGDDTRGIRNTAIALFLMETSSYPLTKILLLLATVVGYLAMARKPGGKWLAGYRWRPILVATGIAAICSAPEWMTTLPSLRLVDRLETDIYGEYTYTSPSNFMTLATMFLPGIFLMRDTHQLAMVWLERSWWIGSLTLGVILGALRARVLSLKGYHVPATIAVAALLFSMGGHSFARELSAILVLPLEHLRHTNMGRMITMAFLAFVGGLALTAFERKSSATPDPKDPWVARGWILFFVAACVIAVSEGDRTTLYPRDLYRDPSAGWKIESLHTLFYLLLGYTFYARRTHLMGKWKWPIAVVILQFVSMVDTGYAFRHLVAREEGLRAPEEFAIQSPHPNERSTKGWMNGNDWINWHGNLAILNAHNPPYHHWLARATADPRTRPMVDKLVSCHDSRENLSAAVNRDLPGAAGYSCAQVSFRIDRYFGNLIELSGSGPTPALMVIHDLNDSGWSATLNDQPATILPAYDYFKAIAVPPNEPWKIRLEYHNGLFPFLWFLGALGFLLLIWLPKPIREFAER